MIAQPTECCWHMTSWQRGIGFYFCLTLVTVLVSVGFELKVAEAAAMWALWERAFCVPTAQQATALPTEQTYPTLLFHHVLHHHFVNARELHCGWGI